MRLLTVAGVVVALASAACVGPSECVKHGGDPWLEYESENFLLRSDAPPDVARGVIAELERARLAMLSMWPGVNRTARVDAVLLRSHSGYTEFAPDTTAGIFVRNAQPLILTSSRSYLLSNQPDLRVVYHELAHYLGAHGMLRHSRWLAEGTAGFLETVQFNFEDDAVRLGVFSPRHFNAIRSFGVLPLDALWRWDEPADLTVAEQAHRYASSWAWVHFLMNRREAQFTQFMAALGRAENPRTAWRASFDESDEALAAEVTDFFAAGSYSVTVRRIPLRPSAVKERELSPTEIHLLRARLHALPWGDDAAREPRIRSDLELAQQLGGDSFEGSLAALWLEEDPVRRVGAARSLASRFPERAQAHLELAKAMVMARQGPPEEVVGAFRRAVELEPDNAEALTRLALAEVSLGRPDGALELAERAVAARPWVPTYVNALGIVQAATGRCAEAVQSGRRAIELLGEGDSPVLRERYRAVLSEWEAGCRQRAGEANVSVPEAPPR